MQNKLPQFEANQVLSNVHLNQFIEYLEEQGRLTRNQLLGAGIVSGLDVKRDFATLANSYSLFNGTTGEIFSLIESSAPATTDVNVKNLTDGELNDHIIILFLEIKVKELKNCKGEDCIDLGKEISYNIQPLVISKTDAD